MAGNDTLRGELRVLLGKMELRDDAKIERCIEILTGSSAPVIVTPAEAKAEEPKKKFRSRNAGDPE